MCRSLVGSSTTLSFPAIRFRNISFPPRSEIQILNPAFLNIIWVDIYVFLLLKLKCLKYTRMKNDILIMNNVQFHKTFKYKRQSLGRY
ncbi:LOW QUALITY PROTEIN: hypothetical protein HZS_5802 [Henneguya salminicola]|nr:LOW QUALITY PROTEIN: hypothetical protein HZS_5802 [Henneguya salminicola]